MTHYRSLDEIKLKKAWLTVGVFDGVHLGHQELIHRLVSAAHSAKAPAVVLTFDPHPAVVLGGLSEFKCLTTVDERAALLDSLGVDEIVTMTFDRTLADETAEDFMRRVSKALGLRTLLIGYDTALGRGREGNAARLAEIGRQLRYRLEVVPPVHADGEVISSTRIRARLAVGDVAAAAGFLGRPYVLRGPVIHGDGRGRKINIPTANIQLPSEKVIPANGVYACWAWVGGEKHAAVTNIGTRPTFTPDEFQPHVEAHLLDFQREIYTQEVRLEFVARLRPEQKFPSVPALLEQIQADITSSRAILGSSQS